MEHKWLNLIKQSLNTHANISKTTIDFMCLHVPFILGAHLACIL